MVRKQAQSGKLISDFPDEKPNGGIESLKTKKLDLAPQSFKELYLIGHVFEAKGEFTQAEQIFKKLLKADFDDEVNSNLRRKIADIYLKQRKYKEAVPYFKEKLSNPYNRWISDHFSEFCRHAEISHEIEQLFNEFILESDNKAPYFERAGGCLVEQGRMAEANHYFDEARKIRLQMINPVTKGNFHKALEIINDQSLVVLMQYPVRILCLWSC